MKKQKIYRIILLLTLTFSLVTCKKDDIGSLPTISTYSPEYIASTAVTVGVTVDPDGDSDFVCGIYMGVSQNPETTGTQFQIGNDVGTFLGQITGLTPETEYFVKAYVKNSDVENLAEELSFTTPAKITDFDNNVYETVIMGDQVWMAENLRTTHYLNGDLIDSTDPATLNISVENTPKYQWSYDGNDVNTLIYGKLYTYYTISDTRKICPAGWHVPSDSEFTSLEATLGGYDIAGSKLKEAGNSHWISPYNVDATNESLYTALPGGYRNNTGEYSHMENYGYWWSSTESDDLNGWVRSLYVQASQITREDFTKNNGAAVRCIKDL